MNDDLINREAVKNFINEVCFSKEWAKYRADYGSRGQIDCILTYIDNAPAVPERDYSQGWHDAITKALNEAYTFTTDDGTFKVVQTETLEGLGMSMPMPERPKGEWILNKDGNPECPFCHHSFTYWGNFCGNCGADMR